MDGDKYVAMDAHKAGVGLACGWEVRDGIDRGDQGCHVARFHQRLERHDSSDLCGKEHTPCGCLTYPHVAELTVCNPRRNKLLEEAIRETWQKNAGKAQLKCELMKQITTRRFSGCARRRPPATAMAQLASGTSATE
jgi:hypothetical protein